MVVPLNHPFLIGFFPNKPSSYGGPHGTPISLMPGNAVSVDSFGARQASTVMRFETLVMFPEEMDVNGHNSDGDLHSICGHLHPIPKEHDSIQFLRNMMSTKGKWGVYSSLSISRY